MDSVEPTTPSNAGDYSEENRVGDQLDEDSKRPKHGEKRRYHCTFAGCNRDYSRAEHLYRHQLNHNPKEIFRCHYPGCTRTFVRQDLCNRHQERHFSRARQESAPSDARHSVTTAGHSSDTDEISALVALGSANNSSYQRARTLPAGDISRPTTNDGSGHISTPSRYPNILNNPSAQPTYTSSTSTLDALKKSPEYREYDKPSVFTRPPEPSSLAGRKRSRDLVDLSVSSSGAPPRRLTDASTNGRDMLPSSGSAVFNESPISMRDEFTNWLFDDVNTMSGGFGGLGLMTAADGFGSQIYPTYFDDSGMDNIYDNMSPHTRADLGSAAISSTTGHLLSPAKRQTLIALIELRFTEDDAVDIAQLRDAVLGGDQDSEDHVLSMRSLQNYIGSYWFHFHEQIPVLHQPTFSADQTHSYLLLAIMIIGASYLNKAHGRSVTSGAAKFAAFIAWHLRWQIFKDPDFRPPAKLWVFQTLLLLEVYEKLSASRLIHERAHIHSATTITLMRRGTALIDSGLPHDVSRSATTPEQWWGRWIQSEATHRAALAAFYLDALSATLFGHAAMMVVHEVRLPLPCDDALWSATSAAEVARVEASLHANGVQPPTFTEALRKILTGRKVRTNPFGRMVLMAGLLSISWHMQQRDLQMSVLGVSRGMGGVMGTLPSGWREPLMKSFDFWKKDFEESRAHMQRIALPWQTTAQTSASDNDNVIVATNLWHLAHMAMHVDFRDLQIFAGARYNLGRPIADTDRERTKNNISAWIKSPGGRTAVWHALQLLRETLLPKSTAGPDGEMNAYVARDDNLTHRPWTLYVAGLMVFCWGYMTDGLLRPFPAHLLRPANGTIASGQRPSIQSLTSTSPSPHPTDLDWSTDPQTQAQNFQEAKLYLQTIGSAVGPAELETIKAGRNNVVGLLRTLEFAFRDAKWELLREGAERLRAALVMLER
ncbi:uncharacterized protein HMPREF1541_09227 [Cyphellophora europaea CBS 101466]|uniref:C2H2-type domain-containing protein n=1 Tax=Cyphellophora europaea (strain CBS 101466) TaxID=1220924 RepID=W2S9L4_CYPE1|nr:uncharacterized protein HMPREF1541_09227 [Cyphellophora europaea CBS 101466]ETN45396.1 hypothetical protein HMPREF1541_09227 [Cyphellophora europaea CBS 101466]